ncbi:hypothetical protein GF314_01140, partial [bacterium]|nr:hypothetical protein [bacterium]
PRDTTYVLGGPDRWDGRFEDADGQPAWHGWQHADLYHSDHQNHWTVSDLRPIHGERSLWCGTWFGDDDGYGNDWADPLVLRLPAADPEQPTALRWQCVVRVDTEPGYDYLRLQVAREGGWQDLMLYDGDRTLNVDLTVTVEPEDYADGHWRLRYLATSDAAWSDEDGLYLTDGHSRVDDITVRADGVIVNQEDLEDGLTAWKPGIPYLVGDFTALRKELGDLDPDHDNMSWQVTFIDDGIVVPGTGGTPCVDWCYGPDGWVYNVTTGLHLGTLIGPLGPFYLNSGVWNGIISPALAWPDGADTGAVAFDVYAHMQTYVCGLTTYGWTWRATTSDDPEALDAAEWQTTHWSVYEPDKMPPGPGYYRVDMRLDVDMSPFRWVQVRLEALEAGPYCWGEHVDQGTPAPYFDNIAVRGWVEDLTDVVPDAGLALAARPNPFNPRVTLAWNLPRAGAVELLVFDARGRCVRRLLADERPAGAGSLDWDGRDDTGRALPSGTYVARLSAGDGVRTQKLVLVR